MKIDCITPGKPWLDTSGKLIQAHGGSIITIGDKYYWYGENKEKTLPGSKVWHWGVKLYSSDDLYNWKDEGIILSPSDDINSPLHSTQCMDRPHILYNERTKKFVMWVKIMNRDNLYDNFMVISTADKITDEFKIVNVTHILDMSSGDFDLVCDEETKKAYIYFDKVHSEMICAELNDDYTDVTGKYTSHLPEPYCPLVREAPAFFKRNGKMYLLTSGTTGYFPNPTTCAVADDYHGPWTDIGTVHEDDTENLSFRSQISSVFKHPKKDDLYIALADRWLVNLPDDMPNNLFEIIVSDCAPDKELIIPRDEYDKLLEYKSPDVRNMSIAGYVWLPIVFERGRPVIKWHDSWKIEDF